MAKKIILSFAVLLLLVSFAIAGCSDDDNEEALGSLRFVANGEDFVREGFVSKDGWNITFDHVYITLSNVTAYQTEPPYDPHIGGLIDGKVEAGLQGTHTVDLAEGDEAADPITVGEETNVATGHYNAIYWKMDRATAGPSAGYSLVMTGTAEKNGLVEVFSIMVDDICEYSCGEYVGDERKGVVAKDGTSDLEMTFHFDHLFGDAGIPADDELNIGAYGFEALLAMSESDDPDMDMAEIHLGHVGEGHCHCECE